MPYYRNGFWTIVGSIDPGRMQAVDKVDKLAFQLTEDILSLIFHEW